MVFSNVYSFFFVRFDFHHVAGGFRAKPQLYSLRGQYLFTVVCLVWINCDSLLRHCAYLQLLTNYHGTKRALKQHYI